MPSKKIWLREAKLYLILDAQVVGLPSPNQNSKSPKRFGIEKEKTNNSYTELLDILKKSVKSGVDIVQLRDKNGCAKDILEFSRTAKKIIGGKIPFVVNDRVDLAMIAQVSGVHLGQDDISLKIARRMMGEKAIIGVSCQTLEHARRAQREGADYIGFGSIFKTQTKPGRTPMNLEILKKVVRELKIPVFAIGGIGRENVESLRALGVSRVAVCRDVCLAKDQAQAVREIKKLLVD